MLPGTALRSGPIQPIEPVLLAMDIRQRSQGPVLPTLQVPIVMAAMVPVLQQEHKPVTSTELLMDQVQVAQDVIAMLVLKVLGCIQH